MIPAPLRARIEAQLGVIVRATPMGAGAHHVETSRGSYFLKTGGAGTFEAEAQGLEALRAAAEGTAIRIPRVYLASDAHGLLAIDWIAVGRPDRTAWARFGEALAALHRRPAPGRGWGFGRDNFIGPTPQPNGWLEDWPTFFRERRLLPQMDLARRRGRWLPRWDRPAERLLDRLPDLLPSAPPRSLLHGDLWSGNHLTDAAGTPWLVDPAVYVGDREADLAMTELFGGFDPAFYAAYESAWPHEPGYAERREVYNLYHLLNHLNLFGSGYAAGVERVLLRFGT